MSDSIREIKSAITLHTSGRSCRAAYASALRNDASASLSDSSTDCDSAMIKIRFYAWVDWGHLAIYNTLAVVIFDLQNNNTIALHQEDTLVASDYEQC